MLMFVKNAKGTVRQVRPEESCDYWMADGIVTTVDVAEMDTWAARLYMQDNIDETWRLVAMLVFDREADAQNWAKASVRAMCDVEVG